MGSLSEDGEINRELLIAEGVQVVFSISAVGLTEANKADAVELQSATNIPVVLLDGSMNIITDCYTKLGSILGRESRAAELAAYCSRVYDDVIGAVADLTEDEKVNFYYAEGPQGLQTEPSTSQHALVFDLAGAKNVAQVPEGTAYGMSDVSLEQVIAWDPEVIIAWSWEVMGGADERIKASSNWANIKAVRDGRVYTMPDIPFAWLDRPPGVNRFLGLQWIANLFYPERYDIDMVEEGKAFYELFYQIEVSDDEMKGFLGNSYPVGGTA
jgi:iron complex transport system substrate-binding protein